jgi:hypothetical protein
MSEAAHADPISAGPVNRASQAAELPADPAGRVAELQVTAHLMTLETGLFCVFQTPGSAPPELATGLPGVRITPAPGIAGRPEAVSVSTFREDGWLSGTAALVRVTDGSAQILVTIYQHKGMDSAPRLQVLRLSGEPTAGAPESAAVAAPPVAAEPVTEAAAAPQIMAHVQRLGDVGCQRGDWMGTKGSGQWIEGFGMAPLEGLAPEDLEYQAVLGRNWLSPWVESGKFCGSRGMALPLLGLKVRLKGAAAKAFACSYSATFVDGSEAGPVDAGETCEAGSLAALESFQIVIQPRGGKILPVKVAGPVKAVGGKAAPAKPTMAKPMTAKSVPAKPMTAKPVPAKRVMAKPAAKTRAKA